MDSTGKSLLNLLFNPGETICVSPNEFGYHAIPLENAFKGKITLVSPNEAIPISYCSSSELILAAINPIKGWRRDDNVTAFRSFLLEADTGSIKEQLGYIDHLKMPFSVQVFSGNKSVHTVITLDEDLPDEKTYRHIGNWIFNIVSLADKNCRNPSRSVRIPGAYRDQGKKQRLIKLNKRISHKELFDWLNKFEHLRPKVKEKKKALVGEGSFDRLSTWAKNQLKYGLKPTKGRNQNWYGIFYDFALAGYSMEETIDLLKVYFVEERDFKESEWLTTAKSAFSRVK